MNKIRLNQFEQASMIYSCKLSQAGAFVCKIPPSVGHVSELRSPDCAKFKLSVSNRSSVSVVAHTAKLQPNSLLRLPSHSNRIMDGFFFQCICDRLPQRQIRLSFQALAIPSTKKQNIGSTFFRLSKTRWVLWTAFGWQILFELHKSRSRITCLCGHFLIGSESVALDLMKIPIMSQNFVKIFDETNFVFHCFNSFAFKFRFFYSEFVTIS